MPVTQDKIQVSSGEDHGIIPRAICDLFAMIGLLKQEDSSNLQYTVHFSALYLFAENFYDLMQDAPP